MRDSFITNILVRNSRNVTDLEIPLSIENRQHLIFTGKNGSGKTSLLLEINKFLYTIENNKFRDFESQTKSLASLESQLVDEHVPIAQKENARNQLVHVRGWFSEFGGTNISFSRPSNDIVTLHERGELLIAYFDSKRQVNFNVPNGISKVNLRKNFNLAERFNVNFIQYIVNLKADRSFAKDDNEIIIVEKIDQWFERFENGLREIFDAKILELKFDRNSYNFNISLDNGIPFNFNNLSDGYSSILSIVAEILMRMEAHDLKVYDLEGIVLIDEIETHLHVALQKKILPFLTSFFPKVQFIVTTHSPFVLSSLSNATICDLETKTVTTDLSAYSYDALLESYFETDKYSDELKEKLGEFERLTFLVEKTKDEEQEMSDLRNYFAHAPKYLSPELLAKIQEIRLSELNIKKQ